jgi:flagellin
MSTRINSNISALTASRNLRSISNRLGSSISRLSSGLRVNRGADDAAGLAISESLRAQVRGYAQASRNANDGISMVQTAEGSLSEINSLLGRAYELATQSANGVLSSTQRTSINTEFTAIKNEITRISNITDFNGTKLLDGTLASSATAVNIQVGLTNTANSKISVNVVKDVDSSHLSINSDSLGTAGGALSALGNISSAISTVSDIRGQLGAVQNRLGSAISSLDVTTENLTAAESAIRDVDFAQETAEFSKNQILTQAATSVLAQANMLPQNVLQLLG